jgi:cyclopropane fatty-acyl-phospholipid synthase-like methyltransferase
MKETRSKIPRHFAKRAYNEIAKKYANIRSLFDSKRHLESFCRLLEPGATVLDVGCGNGKPIDEYLTKRGYLVTGIDISDEQIRLARESFPQSRYFVEDMTDLREKEYSVDGIVSFYAIFHTPRSGHLKLLKKLNTFLTIGGVLLITLGTRKWEGTKTFLDIEMYWSMSEPTKNREIIRDAGFSILKDVIDSQAGEHHHIVLATKIREVI